jgi:hypothetical protein
MVAVVIALITTVCLLVGVIAAWIRRGAGAPWATVIGAGAGAFAATAVLIFAAVSAWGAVAAQRHEVGHTCPSTAAMPAATAGGPRAIRRCP